MERKQNLNLNSFEYASLLALENKIGEESELIGDIQDLYTNVEGHIYQNWKFQITTKKEIQKIIRMFLLRYIKNYSLTLKDIDELSSKIFDNLKQYEKRD